MMEVASDKLSRLIQRPLGVYVLVVAGTAIAAALRWVLGLYFDGVPAFITFYPLVMISAVSGGTYAGLLATLLSAVAVTGLFLAHPRDLYLVDPGETVSLVLFTFINAGISALGGRLRGARLSAEKANRAKDYFFAVLSHELRTPLMPISWSAQLLAEDNTLSLTPEQREHLARIRRNVAREDALIKDLLDVNRVIHGKLQLNFRKTTLQRIIQNALDTCRPEIESRRLHVAVDAPAEPCFVAADELRLEQVFSNLLRNAIKFTPEEGYISVRSWEQNGELITEVNDTGAGIEPQALERIFRAFEQAKGAGRPAAAGQGLGLGLVIAKAIIERHGGSISAASTGPGQGSTFSVRLPAMRPRGAMRGAGGAALGTGGDGAPPTAAARKQAADTLGLRQGEEPLIVNAEQKALMTVSGKDRKDESEPSASPPVSSP